MRKKYFTEEERKAARRESDRRKYLKHRDEILEKRHKNYQENKEKIKAYREENKEKIAEIQKKWKNKNKEHVAEYNAQYYSEFSITPRGRAFNLVGSYRSEDKKHGRGECTLTADWIVENIFTKPCHYCGETEWTKIGCDRIDNSLPHTPENVVPCCCDCNKKRRRKTYEDFMKLIGKIA